MSALLQLADELDAQIFLLPLREKVGRMAARMRGASAPGPTSKPEPKSARLLIRHAPRGTFSREGRRIVNGVL